MNSAMYLSLESGGQLPLHLVSRLYERTSIIVTTLALAGESAGRVLAVAEIVTACVRMVTLHPGYP